MSLLLLLRPDYQSFIPTSFHGRIDEVAAYATALTATQVRQHYQTAMGIPGAYGSLVSGDGPEGYWRFDDSLVDLTGHGHNGVATGTTSAISVLDLTDAQNSIALRFREVGLDEVTQLDLEGMTQADLAALPGQPTLGQARFANRRQAELDVEAQSSLDRRTQFDLERVIDTESEAYIEVRLDWTSLDTTLTISTGEQIIHAIHGLPLLPQETTPYVLLVAELKDQGLRVRLFKCDQSGSLLDGKGNVYALLYDTGLITDPISFKRRKGRFGWYASLADGDASVENIRPRGLSFGEVITKTMPSTTPVDGVSLTTHTSSDHVLFNGLPMRSPWGGDVQSDPAKTTSGKAVRVRTNGGPLQGIQTGRFIMDDFSNVVFKFDILFPATALTSTGSGLEAFLYGEHARIIPVNLGGFKPDHWQTLHVQFRNNYFQSGEYVLMLVQTNPVAATWWVDNFDMRTRSVGWSARAKRPDAWGMEPDNWTEFKDTVNKAQAGIALETGRELQIRGKAFRQDAFISEVKAVPKYAGTGNFYWPDAHPRPTSVPLAHISFTKPPQDTHLVNFTAAASTGTGANLVAYHWSFGDGSEDYGVQVTHRYPENGVYTTTLTVIDSNNLRGSITATVTV